jgi:outer membrane protein assembly factor BamB
VWRYNVNGSANELDFATRVFIGADGQVLATGLAYDRDTGANWVAVKLDAATGTEIWRRVIDGGTGGDENAPAATVDANGDLIVGGRHADTPGASRFVVMKLSGADGTELWRYQTSPGSFRDAANAVAVEPGGAVIAAGITGSVFTVVRLAGSSGLFLWEKFIAPGEATAVTFHPVAGAIDVAGDLDGLTGTVSS